MQSYAMRSTPSVYSQMSTGRSTFHSSGKSRSQRRLAAAQLPWYRKPLLREHKRVSIQKAAVVTSICSMVACLFTIATSVFDIYCLAMARPGSTHSGYFMISYEFVYVGNPNVRNGLIVFAMFSFLVSSFVLATSMILFVALRKHEHNIGTLHRKEYEKRMLPWMWSAAVWWTLRLLALILFAVVQDLMFAYNWGCVLVWSLLLPAAVYSWLLVHTCYLEFASITRLEDLAHLRICASLHASTSTATPHAALHGELLPPPATPHGSTHATNE